MSGDRVFVVKIDNRALPHIAKDVENLPGWYWGVAVTEITDMPPLPPAPERWVVEWWDGGRWITSIRTPFPTDRREAVAALDVAIQTADWTYRIRKVDFERRPPRRAPGVEDGEQ